MKIIGRPFKVADNGRLLLFYVVIIVVVVALIYWFPFCLVAVST